MDSHKVVHGEDLALFSGPTYNSAVDRIQWVDYQPSSSIKDQSPLEFTIPRTGAQYINLKRSYLLLKLRILKADGSSLNSPTTNAEGNLEANVDKVSTINIPFDSIWSQVDLYLQQKLISSSGTNYPYKAIIETLLDYGLSAKNSQLQCRGYYKDTAVTINTPNVVTGGNTGLTKRYSLFSQSKTADFIGNLRSDFCQQDKLLLNGVEVQIKLWPCKHSFTLLTSEDDPDYKISIVDAVFKVCKVTLKPEVNIVHNELLTKSPIEYAFERTQIKVFNISSGEYSFRFDDVYSGDIPSFLVLGLISSKAYTGDYKSNPFNFVHKNLNSLGIYINDEALPARPMVLNFNEENYMEAYHNIFTSLGVNGKDMGIDITHADFLNGYALFVFNLNSDELPSTSRRGNLKIEGNFLTSLNENTTLLSYGKFPFMIHIDETRNVLL